MNQKLASGLAAGVAVLCFFPWYEITFAGEVGAALESLAGGRHVEVTNSATGFQSVEGTVAFVAALVAVMAGPLGSPGIVPLDRGRRALLTLGVSALALLCMVVVFGRLSAEAGEAGGAVRVSKTIWFFSSMGLAAGAMFFGYRECRALQST